MSGVMRVPICVGDTFGRWTVRKVNPTGGKRTVVCDCACGTVGRLVRVDVLRRPSGGSRSCGCLERELKSQRTFKHGHTYVGGVRHTSPEYRSWRAMRDRCYKPSDPSYQWYGAIGVTVCDQWNDPANGFAAFLADVGPCPTEMCRSGKVREYTIDRYPNKSGNYEPGNVRWATRKEQIHNRNWRKKGGAS